MCESPISVIIAVNNEEANITPLYARLQGVLENVADSWEVIFVDDGSTDTTGTVIRAIAEQDARVIPLSSHVPIGQIQAILLGLPHATGEILITMDGDLQHLPEEIPRFVEAIHAGYDLVNGRKVHRQDNLLTRTLPALVAKWVVRTIFSSTIYDPNSTFRAYRRHLVPSLLAAGECIRFAPLISDLNARVIEIPIQCPRRIYGRSHFHLVRRLERLLRDVRLLRTIKRTERVQRGIETL